MIFSSTTSDGTTIEHATPANMLREMLVGETLTIGLAGRIVVLSAPDGEEPTIDAATFTPHAPGRYLLGFEAHVGLVAKLQVCACDPAVLARIPDYAAGASPGTFPSAAHKRDVLRALTAHASWFAGTVTSLVGRSLRPFGA